MSHSFEVEGTQERTRRTSMHQKKTVRKAYGSPPGDRRLRKHANHTQAGLTIGQALTTRSKSLLAAYRASLENSPLRPRYGNRGREGYTGMVGGDNMGDTLEICKAQRHACLPTSV